MLNKKVEITQLGSIYFGMIGTVILEEPEAVFVEIPIAHEENHKVMFYKFQITVLS